ncbi:MAG: RICIN domain-containing protein, partial [Caldilineaceae bacterium]
MQHTKHKIQISLILLVAALLVGGMMWATGTTQAAPVLQESGDDSTLDNSVFIPFVAGKAIVSAAVDPLTPDQYDAESEEAPVLSDDQIQSSTFCSSYIKFTNSSSYTIKVYYVNSWGQETLYKTMSSGSNYWQQTYYGNDWKVRDSSGNHLKSFSANSCFYMYITIDNNDFPQPTATPTSPAGGACYTEIIATHSNKCMDVASYSTSNNAQIQQYSCSGGDNQKFYFTPVAGKADTYLIRAKHSGKAVDVLNGSSSA